MKQQPEIPKDFDWEGFVVYILEEVFKYGWPPLSIEVVVK